MSLFIVWLCLVILFGSLIKIENDNRRLRKRVTTLEELAKNGKRGL